MFEADQTIDKARLLTLKHVKFETKNRILLACLLLVASLLGGLVGEALFLTFTFLKNHGCLPPASSLWSNAVWVEGFALFLPASPGLLVLLLYHVAIRRASFHRLLVQFSCSVLFTITSGLSGWIMKTTIQSMTGGALVALVLAFTLVLVERTKSQNKAIEAT